MFGKLTLALALMLIANAICAPQRQPFPHPAVLKNSQLEAQLAPHLKNPFYQDPRTARALAYHSWLAPGEELIYEREAEKIPRREIYNVLIHAGFISRQRTSPDFLQRL